MPSIPEKLTDAVFYLFAENPDDPDNPVGPYGTGFIVSRNSAKTSLKNYYGITNIHVAAAGGASIIRLNSHDGSICWIRLGPEEWCFDPIFGDVAAVDLTERLKPNIHQVSCIDELSFVWDGFSDVYPLRLGADVFMIGLFAKEMLK